MEFTKWYGIGLYTKTDLIVDGTQHYDAIDFELDMSLSLYNYYNESNIHNVFHWNPTVEQWWITGFNPKLKDLIADNRVSIGKIDFSDNVSMYNSLKTANEKIDNLKNILLFDDTTYTVWTMFN